MRTINWVMIDRPLLSSTCRGECRGTGLPADGEGGQGGGGGLGGDVEQFGCARLGWLNPEKFINIKKSIYE